MQRSADRLTGFLAGQAQFHIARSAGSEARRAVR